VPLYEYICDDCSAKFELRRSFSQGDGPVKCIYCQSGNTRKAISVFACVTSKGGSAGSSLGNSGGDGGSCPLCRS
jgi:putative FmdB family regulatory protein